MHAGNQAADADDQQRAAADVLAKTELDPGQPGQTSPESAVRPRPMPPKKWPGGRGSA
jgi:hypothetical protein